MLDPPFYHFLRNIMPSVIKRDGSTEPFDLSKIERLFNLASFGYPKCSFVDFTESFRNNIVDGLTTKDITSMMVKTCIDLVSVENIDWEHIAARIKLYDYYKSNEYTYSKDSYVSLVRDMVNRGEYSTRFAEYSDEELAYAANHIDPLLDTEYRYTTIHSLTKRYLKK